MRRTIALGVVAMSLAIAYGIWYAYSVILVALLAEFGWSRSVLAGAFSVFTLVHGAVNPLVGMLCARFRPLRVMAAGGAAMGLTLFLNSFISTPLELYLLFSVATAIAIAFAGWVPSLVFVQRNFPERLGFSVGIISSGVGVGMFLVVPLTQLLIDAYGWRTAFRALALISVVWIVPSSLWLRGMMLKDQEIRGQGRNSSGLASTANSSPDPSPNPTLGDAMRTQTFWLLMAMFFFGNVASQTLHVHQVAYLVDHGLAAIVAASVVSVVGLASIVGKTGGGWLSDRVEREWVYVAGVAILAASAFVLLALGAGPSAWAAYGYAVLLGLGYSVTAAITPLIVSDRFGGPRFGAIVGVGLMGTASGSALGPWLAGRLYDANGSYTLPFLIAAGCSVVAGVAAWRVRSLKIRGQSPKPADAELGQIRPSTPANSSPDPRTATPEPAGLNEKVDAQGGQNDKMSPQMDAATVHANLDPEATADGGFVIGSSTAGRQLLTPEELATRLTALMRSCEGCENVTVLEVYRTEVDRKDGCNWSLALLLDSAGVAPEVYSLAYASVLGTARKSWNLVKEDVKVAVLDLDLG